jgi:hypothetical protein
MHQKSSGPERLTTANASALKNLTVTDPALGGIFEVISAKKALRYVFTEYRRRQQ